MNLITTENCPTCNQKLDDHNNQQISTCIKKQLEQSTRQGDSSHD